MRSLTKTADSIYALGLGSKDVVIVEIPSGVTAASISGKSFTLNLSIRGSTTQFDAQSLAPLNATGSFLSNITEKGTHRVNVETYKNNSGHTNILFGGYCGDGLCTSSENSDSCGLDCTEVCGDGICNFPGSEGCEANYCNDCVGSQAECLAGETCREISGAGVCSILGSCGDGLCAYPFAEDCNSCAEDCLAAGFTCCFDPILGYYYSTAGDCDDIPPSVTDCGDFCKWLDFTIGAGYDNGVCRQSVAQCTVNDEIYEPSGDIYCTGDPVIDTCCCIPSS